MDKQDEHYHFLNEKVFKPLSEVKLERDGLRLSANFPTNSFLWPSAVKHMLKAPDNPRTNYVGYARFPRLIEEIKQRIESHNQKAATLSGTPFDAATKDLLHDLRVRGEPRISDLENDANEIEKDIGYVRNAFLTWSDAIEFGQQRGIVPKADCCPTVFTILSQVWS